MQTKDDIPEALEALKDRPLYAEKWAYFKMVYPPPLGAPPPHLIPAI